MSKIQRITAREVLDSRGNPTLEVDVITKRAWGRAIVPSGASTGTHEALELRDGDKKRFHGKGVKKAVSNINNILSKKLSGMDVSEQRLIDQTMIETDGTANKKKLGANAILGVSMATARAGAMASDMNLYDYLSANMNYKKVLPVPFSNIINGGAHAGNRLAFQEFMIAPVRAKKFSHAAQMVSETYHTLKEIISKKYGKNATNVGDEGGFAPPLATADEALELISQAIKDAGYRKKIRIAMDAAASEICNKGVYKISEHHTLDAASLSNYYQNLISKYKIISIEDPFEQDSYEAWQNFNKKAGIQVVGDDLLVTNPERIKLAESHKLCNALLLKVNQIGTLTQAMDAASLAYRKGWSVMVSHRSGESEDPFISDLSVALGCGQIKIGAPARGERTAKYNQLLRIEEELGKNARYARLNVR